VRISADLPEPLVDRLNRQAEDMHINRAALIEAACEALLRELEAIDAEARIARTWLRGE
jgi:metal-responsive CopG/Arc/MetJ family transcriptional regulator